MNNESRKYIYNLSEEVENIDTSFFEDEVRDGFYVWSMMKRYWAGQLRVLAEIDKVCKKHNIRWFADNGTLLGAVRHGGYIPWDDDMDICMLREDYNVFMENALSELPSGYEIMTVQNDEEYEYMIGRVINTHVINFKDEHLESHFGCPYLVGVDIFPLDGLMEDSNAEEERRKMLLKIGDALLLVKSGKNELPECRQLLREIEQANHVVLHRKGKIDRELLVLADKIYQSCPTKNAEYITLMPTWVKRHGRRFTKEWFENTVYLPFEYVHIPVPAMYEEVIKNEYRSFARIVRTGGAHEYPLYEKQEKLLKERISENPYRFTMPKTLPDPKNVISVIENCAEIIETLKQAHEQLRTLFCNANYEMCLQLMNGCMSLAESLNNYVLEIRNKCDECLSTIRDYKEILHIYLNSVDLLNADELNGKIRDFESAIADLEEPERKEILFLPVKASWWKTMETEWKRVSSDPKNDVFVMPLLYLEKDFIKDNGEEKNDADLFPEYVKTVSIEEYDIESRHPDVVYIQDPYDGYNTMIAVPSYFYSQNLRNLTNKLVYIPCFDIDDPTSADDKLMYSIKIMAEQPSVYYSDSVLLKTEKLRAAYIDTLSKMMGEETRSYWENKISILEKFYPVNAESKSDDHVSTEAAKESMVKVCTRKEMPSEWSEISNNRKLLLFQVNCNMFLENCNEAMNKIENILKIIEVNKENICCVFSPHESLDYMSNEIMGVESYRKYKDFIQRVKDKADIIYDEEHKANEYWESVDAYYGSFGMLAHKCRGAGIPVLQIN